MSDTEVTFEVNSETPLGTLLDHVVRVASVENLSDFYMGAEIDYDTGVVSTFFSEEAKEEALESLRDALMDADLNISLEETSVGGAAWKLSAKVEEETDVDLAVGQVAIKVPLAGNVPVSISPQAQGAE